MDPNLIKELTDEQVRDRLAGGATPLQAMAGDREGGVLAKTLAALGIPLEAENVLTQQQPRLNVNATTPDFGKP